MQIVTVSLLHLVFYNNLFERTLNNHAPVVTKTINANNRPPWMDREYTDARKERRKLYRIWKKSNSNQDKEEFVGSRLSVNELSKVKRRTFYQNSIQNSSNSQKELYKVTNKILDRNKKSEFPHCENPITLAEKFNNFFIEKIEKSERS